MAENFVPPPLRGVNSAAAANPLAGFNFSRSHLEAWEREGKEKEGNRRKRWENPPPSNKSEYGLVNDISNLYSMRAVM